MSEYCFEVVAAVAIERADIGITVSSTPLGKRSHFYKMCTIPEMGYSQHYHPSTHNPNWNATMEAELRAEYTAEAYIHEVLAEFGTQSKGVFNKDALDKAKSFENYAYNELDFFQKQECEHNGVWPTMHLYSKQNKAPNNIFRTMGVDWDKYQASSSILIMDYDKRTKKFQVFKRFELPRSEYSYDNAINTIIALNEIYDPSWIYCDRGSGEYQIERLHIYGDEHPSSGLKNKVKGWSFSNKLDIMDPISKQIEKKPLKQFMVNQLQILVERNNLILSPYDDVLFKQLVDYEVEKITEAGIPKYTSENEHFVDALGLAYLAMVLEFKDLTGIIEDAKTSNRVEVVQKSFGTARADADLDTASRMHNNRAVADFYKNTDFTEREGDRQRWVKVDYNYRSARSTGGMSRSSWGSRSVARGGFSR